MNGCIDPWIDGRLELGAMTQIARNLTDAEDGFLNGKTHVLIDRDSKFCESFCTILKNSGVEPNPLPARSPNLNAHLERFMRSIKEEALSRLIFFGENMLRNAVRDYLEHYHRERNHQGIDNAILQRGDEVGQLVGTIDSRDRLGGMLNYYYRRAA